MDALLTPFEVDDLLRYRRNTAARLARKGLLPVVILPDGQLRFRAADLRRPIETGALPARKEVRRG